VKYIRVNYAKADETLIEKVKGVLTDRGSVTFDDRTNTIIVRDIPHGTDDASQLIHELDVQSPQVLIEANIVEATRDMARALDVVLGSIDGVHSLAARLTALEQQGKAKVISRPRVITLNNVAATIQSLTILRVKLPSTGTVINTGTGGAAGR